MWSADGRVLSQVAGQSTRTECGAGNIRARLQMRSKVLVLIKGLGLGGAERMLVDCASLSESNAVRLPGGLPAAMEAFSGTRAGTRPESPFTASALRADMIASSEPAGARASMTLLPQALRRLLALQQRERFDVIQADLPVAGILARLAGRWSSVPVVYTEHNLLERYHSVTQWANAATYGWNRRVLGGLEDVASQSGGADSASGRTSRRC